jgi:parallel beta-helix repeat protein
MVGLTSSLFVLSFSNSLNAEGFTSHQGRFWKPKQVSCGDTINTYTLLTADLDCSDHSGSAALTVEKGAKLYLNGKKIIGNSNINCIEIIGDGAKVWRGTVMYCEEGILIKGSDRNKVIDVKACNNKKRGFRIKNGHGNRLFECLAKDNGRKGFSIEEGDDNLVVYCLATQNGQQGFNIEEDAAGNRIYYNKAYANCRDGIEIAKQSNDNWVVNNIVEDNGNREICDKFAENPKDPEDDYYYKPWFYAGIDITDNSENNKIKDNSACGNLGCIGSNDFPCAARERNFWDENLDENGYYDSPNEWTNNTVCPECNPNLID